MAASTASPASRLSHAATGKAGCARRHLVVTWGPLAALMSALQCMQLVHFQADAVAARAVAASYATITAVVDGYSRLFGATCVEGLPY
jgi:hypothetical protein